MGHRGASLATRGRGLELYLQAGGLRRKSAKSRFYNPVCVFELVRIDQKLRDEETGHVIPLFEVMVGSRAKLAHKGPGHGPGLGITDPTSGLYLRISDALFVSMRMHIYTICLFSSLLFGVRERSARLIYGGFVALALSNNCDPVLGLLWTDNKCHTRGSTSD
jgi:hypothetical protein